MHAPLRPHAIRRYDADDAAGCLSVFDSNVPDFFVPHERADFAAFLGELPGPYFVLVDQAGVIVGCGGYALVPGTGQADLCWGMVRRDLHRLGLGRRLTEVRIGEAVKDAAVAFILLNTSQHTRTFYERLGFVCTSVTADGYSPGLDRCEMRLDVGPRERSGSR
jgi:GNAT superfamily N-acetyltransferase